MRYLLITLLLISCKQQKPWYPEPIGVIRDTVVLHDTIRKTDTIVSPQLKAERDSLRRKLLVAEYKIERVKYYLHICIKNPKQDVFLKGWISRAVQ